MTGEKKTRDLEATVLWLFSYLLVDKTMTVRENDNQEQTENKDPWAKVDLQNDYVSELAEEVPIARLWGEAPEGRGWTRNVEDKDKVINNAVQSDATETVLAFAVMEVSSKQCTLSESSRKLHQEYPFHSKPWACPRRLRQGQVFK